MPRKTPPRLRSVTALPDFALAITWDKGGTSTVSVRDFLSQFRFYAPLLADPAAFAQAAAGDVGTDAVWPGGIDMSADTLWRLAQEQAGLTLSPTAFRRWRESRALTLDGAAEALGLSRRMVAYYEQGEKPVPRVVALATRGFDASLPEKKRA